MSGPLEGVTILDCTWALAGPFGTMVLSDLGAETIKIEKMELGDRTRANEPKVDGVSTYFFSINRGKKSVALNLGTEKGKKIFLELTKVVDVVVENFTPLTMDKLGLGYETLKRYNPRLIYACCSGFGHTGPYAETNKPALDVVIQAMGGLMSITGQRGGTPCRVGTSIGDITASLFLCIGILAALVERQRSGQGQMVDISMLDCQAATLENAVVRYFATGEIPQRLGTSHPILEPFGAYPTKDGYVAISVAGPVEQWTAFLEIIGCFDLLGDERLWNRSSRYKYRDELQPIIEEALKKKTTREWVEAFESVGIPCGPVNSIAEAVQDPQLLSRNMFIDLPHSRVKTQTMRVSNTPVKLSRTPAKIQKPAPELGEHTFVVLSTLLGMSQQEIKELQRAKVIGMSEEAD